MNHTEELILRFQGGEQSALDEILRENTGLIWSVVKRYVGYSQGAEQEDLYQLGCLGFIKAVEGFDTEFGTQFSTYAVPKIAGEIRRYLRDDGTIKVSRSIKETAVILKSVRNKFQIKEGRDPALSELSEITGYTVEQIVEAEQATASVESINQVCGTEGFTLEHILTDTSSEDSLLERLSLRQAIEKLPERELLVIKLRYYHGITQSRVAKVLNSSQVQVSRLEKKGLQRLKELMK